MQVATLNAAGRGCRDGPLTQALFSTPSHCACDAGGIVYVADQENHRIRKIAPDSDVSTIAGDGVAGYQDGPGAVARFLHPTGVAVDASGYVFVCDANHCVRLITPEGDVSTLAGSGRPGVGDGQGADARFCHPVGIAVDIWGDVFVADTGNHRIRKITPLGVVTTIAGTGAASSADAPGAPGTSSGFNQPTGIAVDREGNIFVSELEARRIRQISREAGVSTLAGGGGAGAGAGGFRDGVAADVRFDSPCGIAVDGDGNVFVADFGNHRIRRITPDGAVMTVAGRGLHSSTPQLNLSRF